MADLWYPGGIHDPAPSERWGIRADTGEPKFLLHTTEGPLGVYRPDPATGPGRRYFGNTGTWPNYTLARQGTSGPWRIFNHIPANRASLSLRNKPGGPETNRDNVSQIEIAWKAKEIGSLPDEALDELAKLLAWEHDARGVPLTSDVRWVGSEGFGEDAPQRLSGPAWDAYTGVLGHQHAPENCVEIGSKILTVDLRWVNSEDLKPGDSIVGFDEHLVEVGSTGGRRFRPSTIEFINIFNAEGVEVTTNEGSIVVTEDHPWLVRLPYVQRGTRTTWVEAGNLAPGKHEVYFAASPWEYEDTHTAGWLAGVLDADGHVQDKSIAGTWVGFGQLPGPLQDRFAMEMEARGFVMKYFTRPAGRGFGGKGREFIESRVMGGLWEQARAIGTLRPSRLRVESWNGAVVGKTCRRLRILSVRPVGVRTFAGLQTSTKTYIANGYLMHNSHWDPGKFPIEELLDRARGDEVTETDKMDIAKKVLAELRAQVFDVEPTIRQGNAGHVIGQTYNKVGDLQASLASINGRIDFLYDQLGKLAAAAGVALSPPPWRAPK